MVAMAPDLSPRDRPPNVLLIVSDQQRWDLLGSVGRWPVRTPHLDRLAAEGMRFDRAYTPCPLCTPARATLLTGQYPSRHGAWSIGTDTPVSALSLPRLLREQAGYRTAIIGKSHLQACQREGNLEALPRSRDWSFFEQWHGPWYGYDYACINCGHAHEPHAYGMHYGLWLRREGVAPEPPWFTRPGEPADEGDGRWALPEPCHSSTWVADQTIDYLRSHAADHADRPFYACVNFPDPHRPFIVPEPWHAMYADAAVPPAARSEAERAGAAHSRLYRATVRGDAEQLARWCDRVRVACERGEPDAGDEHGQRGEREEARCRIYMAMVSLMDKHIGRILDALDELDLTRETLVVFTSDHGDHLGDHWLWSKGATHFRSCTQVPLIVRWSGRVAAGVRTDALQSLVDLPTTFLRAAGLEPHPAMQGVDQSPCWFGDGRATPRRGVLIDHRAEQGLYVSSWITDHYRASVLHYPPDDVDELLLYDLTTDPDELTDIADSTEGRAVLPDLLGAMVRYRHRMAGPWQSRRSFS